VSRKRKYQNLITVDLFSQYNQAIEQKIKVDFENYAIALIKDGCSSWSEIWWRSRLHDFLHPNHKQLKTENEREYAYIISKNWYDIWREFEPKIRNLENQYQLTNQ
jgi:hypothetical protein